MVIDDRKSISDDLSKYKYSAKPDEFIEVTEWSNGEGWDITINDKQFSLHEDELKAINYLVKHLEYNG